MIVALKELATGVVGAACGGSWRRQGPSHRALYFAPARSRILGSCGGTQCSNVGSAMRTEVLLQHCKPIPTVLQWTSSRCISKWSY